MLRQLLCLLCLSVAREAGSNSVHEVSISVRSVKSIVYRGMQVSIFEHTQMPRRYFFQPLSFLDGKSARLTKNTELKLSELHIDVYLWTDEFIQLVETHFPEHRSVEMLPLTEISLTWSKQAAVWLGEKYNQTFRLLEDWKDGDKPHMRSTFTLFCEKREACEGLLNKFNHCNDAVGHLFDLRYKIQCDNTRNFSLTVRSSHFLQSPAFQQLDRFASQRPGDGRVIVSEQTVDELAHQVYTAALVELQREAKQQFTYVDGESRRAVLTDLHRYLRTDPVHALSRLQWESQVSWPMDRLSLRPDKLSIIFNALFRPAGRPLMVEVTSEDHLTEVRETLPPVEFAKVDAFFRRFMPRRPTDPKPSVPVDEVRDLAMTMASPVAWNASVRRFEAWVGAVMFRQDTVRVKREGTLLIRDALVHYKETAHRDQVTPLPCASAADMNTTWRTQVDLLDTKVQQFEQKVSQMEAKLSRVSAELDSWTSVFAPGRARQSVSTRSGGSGGVGGSSAGTSPLEFYPPPEDGSSAAAVPAEVATLRRSLAGLETRVAELATNRSQAYQPKFADSFCILANREKPPGMTCQVLALVMPKKSLRQNAIFDRRVRYQEGRIGQSHLAQINADFISLGLKICCTV